MPKSDYLNIDDLPKSERGRKSIPQEWIDMVTKIPLGKALVIPDLKFSTTQGRIRGLIEDKVLTENYRVMSRKVKDKRIVYVANVEQTEKKE